MDDDKRERIIETARDVFRRFGFKKTAIDDVAKAAGVAKGTVYLAADSKADLYYEVVYREVRDWNADIARAIDPGLPADQQLALAAMRGVMLLTERPLVRGLFLLETDALIPELTPRLEPIRQLGVSMLSDLVRRGIEQGTFRDDLDVDQVATILLEIQTATLVFHVKDGSLEDPELLALLDRRGAAMLDLIMNGIRAR